jgi:ABC-type cobalamin/Fe3+-siderophores transport system ATPase subunit
MGLELKIAHVFMGYNGNLILRDCSFAFASGRTYVLQGPNGGGKSTLFRLLALLERPDRGEISYRDHGCILEDSLALRRRLTLVLPRTGNFNTTG